MTVTRRKRHRKKQYETLDSQEFGIGGYKQYKGDKRKEEPFLLTNMKVGGVLLIIMLCIYTLLSLKNSASRIIWGNNGNGGVMVDSEGLWSNYVNDDNVHQQSSEERRQKITVFPTFELDRSTQYDAWGISETFFQGSMKVDSRSSRLLKLASQKRIDFASRYGGTNAARAIVAKALVTFTPTSGDGKKNDGIPEGIRYTAWRILEAKRNKRPFTISFAGGSAVTGRGNYFADSFPNVMAQILVEPLSKIGVKVEVRNAAVADIGTFPYGWCLNNFLGQDADVVSWDPEMVNMGDTIYSFEAYLRNAITLSHSPMFIAREYAFSESRRSLLQKYVDVGAMSDTLVVNLESAMTLFKDFDDSIMPEGLKDWNSFSAPAGSPGKTRSNLSEKQHELMGNVLGMYFLAASELVVAELNGLLPKGSFAIGPSSKPDFKHYYLPPPQSPEDPYDHVSQNTTVMFGVPATADLRWYMNDVHCMTTFDPIVYGSLQDNVISGSDAEDMDLMLPKGPMIYNKNWIMDLGTVTKNLVRTMLKFDLGFQDSRKAYFGVEPSGNLTIFIPYNSDRSVTKEKKEDPREAIKSVIVCEANERSSCKIDEDMSFLLGGFPTTPRIIDANGASYSGRKLCVSFDIPDSTKWSPRRAKKSGNLLRKNEEQLGIELSISVANNRIMWKNGPCSISHVIWEQYRNVFK